MAALQRDHSKQDVSQIHTYSYVDVEADANEIYSQAYVQQTVDGYAVIVGDSGGLGVGPVIGVNDRNVPDQTGNAAGTAQSIVYQGLYKRPIASSNPVTDADMFQPVYAANNFDVTNDSTQPLLGVMVGIDNDGGKCTVLISGSANSALSPLVALKTGSIEVRPTGLVDVAGTQLTTFVDGASAQPGLELTDSKALNVRWNNHNAPLAVMGSFQIPEDADTSANMTLKVICGKTGNTDPATLLQVAAFAQVIGALHDADADFGGFTGPLAASASKTVQEVSLTLATADLPAPGSNVTFTIKPTSGTLDTDDLHLFGICVLYERLT